MIIYREREEETEQENMIAPIERGHGKQLTLQSRDNRLNLFLGFISSAANRSRPPDDPGKENGDQIYSINGIMKLLSSMDLLLLV